MKTKRRTIVSSAIYWIFVAVLGGVLFALYANTPHFDRLPSMRVVSEEASADAVPSMRIVKSGIHLPRPSSILHKSAPPETHRRSRRNMEQEVRERLRNGGFPNVGVSVSRSGSVYLAGTIFDPSESGTIDNLVRQTPGVREVHFTGIQILKPSGRAYLGTETGAPPKGHGAVVMKVFRGTPAAVAGVKAGDTIVTFDGKVITDPDQFREIVKSYHGGQRVSIEVVRGSEKHDFTVRLGKSAGELASK